MISWTTLKTSLLSKFWAVITISSSWVCFNNFSALDSGTKSSMSSSSISIYWGSSVGSSLNLWAFNSFKPWCLLSLGASSPMSSLNSNSSSKFKSSSSKTSLSYWAYWRFKNCLILAALAARSSSLANSLRSLNNWDNCIISALLINNIIQMWFSTILVSFM